MSRVIFGVPEAGDPERRVEVHGDPCTVADRRTRGKPVDSGACSRVRGRRPSLLEQGSQRCGIRQRSRGE